jgi:hypothetical protein
MHYAGKWILCGAAAAALAAALWVQTARLKAARASEAAASRIASQWRVNFEAMEAVNAVNVAALEKLQAETARIEHVAAAARQANASQATEIENLRRKLRHVPPSDDGPVRPVLCDAVNELRRLSGESGPACGD